MPPPLSIAAQTLVTERPDGWRYLLFCQVYADELAAPPNRSATQSAGPGTRTGPSVGLSNVESWGSEKLAGLKDAIEAIGRTFTKTIPEAFYPKKGDPDYRTVASAAAKLAHQYHSLESWSAAILNARPEHPVTDELLREIAALSSEPLSILKTIGITFEATVVRALNAPEGEDVDIELSFKPKIDFTGAHRQIAALKAEALS